MDNSDAEKAFLEVDYLKMFGGTQEMMHATVDEFVNIIDRLPSGRRGEPGDWVTHLSGHILPDLYTGACLLLLAWDKFLACTLDYLGASGRSRD